MNATALHALMIHNCAYTTLLLLLALGGCAMRDEPPTAVPDVAVPSSRP